MEAPTIEPNEFDLVVLGTGLPESLVAAAAAKSGHSVLHLDANALYGGCWGSLSVNALQELQQRERDEGQQQQQQLRKEQRQQEDGQQGNDDCEVWCNLAISQQQLSANLHFSLQNATSSGATLEEKLGRLRYCSSFASGVGDE